ncbi:MAG TPA: zinc ABC transporter substrate-binding protein [Staphylococcus sp.]|nr:zinc ABC transporter substrate-binding protein [Staphylococcus sp.]
MKKSVLFILTCVFAVILSACGNINKEEQSDVSAKNKLKVYTTAFAFQSFTEQIGGKYVEAESIYPPGADMHSFEPTQKEMINIAKGDLFIYSNEEMDPVAKKVTRSINNEDLKLAVAKNLSEADLNAEHAYEEGHHQHEDEHDHGHNDKAQEHNETTNEHEGHGHEKDNQAKQEGHEGDEHGHNDKTQEHNEAVNDHEGHDHEEDNQAKQEGHEGHDHGSTDPHVWLDPHMNKIFAKEIRDDLVKKDPKHKAYYTKNYQSLVEDMDDIDKKMKSITKDKKRDTVVISHDSIGYLANRYGFKQVGVSGMNNEEPSQKDLMNIVKNINATKQPYVLYEQNISSKVTDVVRKESATTPLKFHNMATLSKSESEKDDISYQSLMKKNMKSLDKALNQ